MHLAKMLKSGANVLLLDEPTNDLDVDTLRALEEALEDFAGCAVIISHDRWFLDRIATHILAFEGDSHVEWFEGNFQDYEEDKMRRLGTDSTIPHRIKYQRVAPVWAATWYGLRRDRQGGVHRRRQRRQRDAGLQGTPLSAERRRLEFRRDDRSIEGRLGRECL